MMEMMKRNMNRILMLCILFLPIVDVEAETPYKKMIYSTFVNREMYKWGSIIRTFETNNPPETINQKLELVNYYYGFVAFQMGKKQYASALEHITNGEKIVNEILAVSPRNATALSYKGAFIGFRIGISKFKSIYLGPESRSYIDKANEIEPNNVQAIIDKGHALFYAPRVFGGDKEEAIKMFLKAAALMEKNRDTEQNWAYLNLLTSIALAYEKLDRNADAKRMYEKILSKEPHFVWVKNDLYPKLLIKMI